MAGWIKLYRSIQSHWLWTEKPFDKRSAWLDILMLANHDDRKIVLGNELIEVKRGSFITSELKLMERWGWSKSKVRNFLKLLENDNMIIKKADTKKTTLMIVNYSDYQDIETIKEPQKDQEKTDKKLPKDYEETTKRHKQELKNYKELKNNICMYSENLKNVIKLLEENIGVIPPILIDEIDEYSKIFNIEIFSEAIKIAANKKKRTVNYVLGILRNWKDNNILTVDDLEALRKEKELEIKEKQQKQQRNKPQYNKPKKTRFHNFEQRTSSMSNDDLEEIMRRKREEYYKNVQEG